MSNGLRDSFLAELGRKFGPISKLEGSQSLYEIGENRARVYIRYSRLHEGRRTFYGLRREDLRALEGRLSFICFLWEGQETPLVVPFADYEEIFNETVPARDGQYKTQIYLGEESTELYIARAGRFNVDANLGWGGMESAVHASKTAPAQLSHPQVQTLLGAIGALKRVDVWIPPNDREGLDWTVADRYGCISRLPYDQSTQTLLHEIDVVWLRPGSSELVALYEVEHSTPVYSGLLRLNDIHLTVPSAHRLAVVSNELRRSLFVRQLRRPTFQRSGLSEICTFLEYTDVFEWHKRIRAVGGNLKG